MAFGTEWFIALDADPGTGRRPFATELLPA